MKTLVSAFAAAGMLCACATVAPPADSRDQFMATLMSMCGQRFEGALRYAAEAKNDFAGHKISAQVLCSDRGIRMPVQVGADRSRTWIFTRHAAGLELRHDHRHADGTPDAVTMYGGLAQDGGTARSQSFLADAYTARMVPGAGTNVWTVSLSADGQVLTYHLARHAAPRALFVLRRTGRP